MNKTTLYIFVSECHIYKQYYDTLQNLKEDRKKLWEQKDGKSEEKLRDTEESISLIEDDWLEKRRKDIFQIIATEKRYGEQFYFDEENEGVEMLWYQYFYKEGRKAFDFELINPESKLSKEFMKVYCERNIEKVWEKVREMEVKFNF